MVATPADIVHIHLLLNHVPTLGTALALALLGMALVRRKEELLKVGLECTFLVALFTLPAYVSGAATKEMLAAGGELPERIVAAHQNAALMAFLWMQLAGAAAWFALWQLRQSAVPRKAVAAVLGLLLITLAVMGHAANLGGGVRHPEVLPPGAATAPVASWIDAAALGRFFIENLWVWPAAESVHFLGLSLSFGVLLVVHLRQLGIIRQLSDRAVQQLLPWGMLGVALNVLTGMLFFTGVTRQYTENPTFHWKVVFLVLAGLNFLYVTTAAPVAPGRRRLSEKILALSSLAVWVGVLYLGRMLPYLRGSF